MSSDDLSTTAILEEAPEGSGLDVRQLDLFTDSGLWFWNLKTGKCRLSPRLRTMIGAGRDVSGGAADDPAAYIHADDRALVMELQKRHVEEGARFDTEARLHVGDGQFRWFALRGKAFRKPQARRRLGFLPVADAGEAREMVVFVDDIQARKEEDLKRGQLLRDAERFASETAVLNELSRALTTRLNLRDVLEETFKQTTRLIDTSNFFIALYHPEKEEIHFVYDVTDSAQDKDELTIVPAGRGVSGYIIANRTPVLIKDDYQVWAEAHGIESLGEPAKSWLGVPMMIGDRVLGVIAVQSYKDAGIYDEHSLELLSTIASSTAIAIQNALSFESQKRTEADLQERNDQINRLVGPMLEAIEQISAMTTEKKQTLALLTRMTKENHDKLTASDENIKQMAASVEDMMKMVGIIGEISVVVNLLALNATIEAAHAGHLGRGFAVIAGEIRKLSDSTEGQAQEIAEALSGITQSATASAQASGESIQTAGETEVITIDILQFLDDLAKRMTLLSDKSTEILQLMGKG